MSPEPMAGGVTAIVPAAGLGRRFGPGGGKPFVPLLGRPLLAWALLALEACPEVGEVIPVVREADMRECEALVARCGFGKVRRLAPGGPERQDSVRNGLRLIEGEGIVLVHDGARPLLTPALVGRTVGALEGFDGAVAALPPKDTMKEADEGGLVLRTLGRGGLWAVQTPQVFRLGVLREAHEQAARQGFMGTDDASLVERAGGRVRLVEGQYENLKITTPEDILIAEALMGARGTA